MAKKPDYKKWFLEESKKNSKYSEFIDDLEVDGWDLFSLWEKLEKRYDDAYEDYGVLWNESLFEDGEFIVTMKDGKVTEAKKVDKE